MLYESLSHQAKPPWLRGPLLAALLAPVLLAACAGDARSVPPALAPRASPAAPAPVIPGQRPFGTPPPFTLPRVGGGTVSLSDYTGKGPVVVLFYRGFF